MQNTETQETKKKKESTWRCDSVDKNINVGRVLPKKRYTLKWVLKIVQIVWKKIVLQKTISHTWASSRFYIIVDCRQSRHKILNAKANKKKMRQSPPLPICPSTANSKIKLNKYDTPERNVTDDEYRIKQNDRTREKSETHSQNNTHLAIDWQK